MKQKEFFKKTEADQWHERNKDFFQQGQARTELALFSSYIPDGGKVLEIGCSIGENYHSLVAGKKSIEYYGVDLSAKAVEEAKRRLPHGHFSVSSADKLDFPQGHFDFIFFGFCLYVVDREDLARIVAESDRVLKDHGMLGIWDFDNKIPIKRAYRDTPNIFCYKMDYSSLWLALPQYSLVAKRPSSHAQDGFNLDINDRLAASVLLKDHQNAYTCVP